MNNLPRELTSAEIDMISGGGQDAYKTWRQVGIDTANAIEDAVDYASGFLAGLREGLR